MNGKIKLKEEELNKVAGGQDAQTMYKAVSGGASGGARKTYISIQWRYGYGTDRESKGTGRKG